MVEKGIIYLQLQGNPGQLVWAQRRREPRAHRGRLHSQLEFVSSLHLGTIAAWKTNLEGEAS